MASIVQTYLIDQLNKNLFGIKFNINEYRTTNHTKNLRHELSIFNYKYNIIFFDVD
jgi:hypothetical protein